MGKNLTEIVYILDRSGSMSGLEADTIGGFNSMIEKQKETGESAYVSTILFDGVSEVLHDRVEIGKVEKITDKEYFVRGNTALLDAVGGAIKHMGNIHKYAREEDRPAKTIFVITTDGMENSSIKFGYSEVKRLIEKQKEKYGWEFIFIGANIDAFAEAQKFGIDEGRTVNYTYDKKGMGLVFEGISKAVCSVMNAKTLYEAGECLDEEEWKEEIASDFLKRGGKR
jgi:hypothetical protein|nr:VWA domain-containing protein [uncultured Lachnoanaerobaculum sp.]